MRSIIATILTIGVVASFATVASAATVLPHTVLGPPTTTCVGRLPQITNSWAALPGATSYTVFKNKLPGSAWSNVSSKRVGTSYSDVNVTTGVTYQYQVKAFFGNRYTFSNVSSAAAVSCATSVSVGTSTAPSTTTPIITNPVSTTTMSSHVLWGAYAGDNVGDLAAFESQVGAPVNISAYFVGFGDSFPVDIAASLKGTGKTLLIYWEPQVGLTAVNAGLWDSYMRTFADAIKQYGDPVIIAPYHEMNLVESPWSGALPENSPAKLIDAWRHMHDIVLSRGVTNVRWGWAVNQVSNPDVPSNDVALYYPGDAYVDIVGVDGFNFDSPWQSFDDVFGTMLKRVQAYNKPVYVFSMASAPGPQKAAWITDALTTQMGKYNVQAWVWFNQNKEKNWLVSSDAMSLSAFRAAVQAIR